MSPTLKITANQRRMQKVQTQNETPLRLSHDVISDERIADTSSCCSLLQVCSLVSSRTCI